MTSMFPNNQNPNQSWQPQQPQPTAPPTPPQQTSGYAPLNGSQAPMPQSPQQPTSPSAPNPAYNAPQYPTQPQPLGQPPQQYANPPAQNISPMPQNYSPTDAPQPTSTGSDYLNQIATKPKKSVKLFSGKMLILVAILGVALIIFAVTQIFGGDKGPGKDVEVLSARMTNLQSLVEYGQKNKALITSADTTKTVAELSPTLTSRQNDLTTALSSYKGYAKPDKNVVANESDAQLTTTLDTAKTTGQFNSEYTDAIRAEITSTKQALNDVFSQVKSTASRDALQKTYENLTMLEERLPTNASAQSSAAD